MPHNFRQFNGMSNVNLIPRVSLSQGQWTPLERGWSDAAYTIMISEVKM